MDEIIVNHRHGLWRNTSDLVHLLRGVDKTGRQWDSTYLLATCRLQERLRCS